MRFGIRWDGERQREERCLCCIMETGMFYGVEIEIDGLQTCIKVRQTGFSILNYLS